MFSCDGWEFYQLEIGCEGLREFGRLGGPRDPEHMLAIELGIAFEKSSCTEVDYSLDTARMQVTVISSLNSPAQGVFNRL